MLSPEGARGQVMGVLHLGGIMLSTRFLRQTLVALPATLLFAAATSVAVAQTFATVPALSFTKTFGGANPLPQVVTAASTGTQFDVDATASTTTGGSWLQISPSGGVYVTPAVWVVSVNPSVSLAAGTYSEQVHAPDGADALFLQGGDGAVRVVEPERQHTFAFLLEREAIHVFQVDARLLQRHQDVRQPAGFVGYLDGDHVRDLHHEAVLLQHLFGLLPVADHEAQDTETLGIGDGKRQDVKLRLGQHLDGPAERAGLVLQEQRELFDFHG